ncbi:uncharacterized protein LOC114959993 [Acropora millepora]|uniref:uncharacterized protein LOC114959993 n=1 Tax=Acropora millepora TaxID=45264 RepID=UPI001CF4C7C2|nr:uncharacterized protein LOC114959993 [Acropora millepora]
MQFHSPTINHSLARHAIGNVWVTSEIACESACFAEDDCMSVNFGPQNQEGKHLCELSESDHEISPQDLRQRAGFLYKAVENSCSSSPCPPHYKCQTGFTSKGYRCQENWKKVDQTICFQPRGDTHGDFTIKESGVIHTFKLVHQKGTISCYPKTKRNYWGCLHKSYGDRTLVTVITFTNDTVLPLADYARNTGSPCGYYSYKIEGLGVHSKELVFNPLPTSLRVKTGQKFRVWYGGDLVNCGEKTNEGETCADVYAWYG